MRRQPARCHSDIEEEGWEGAPSVHQGQKHHDHHGPEDGRVEQADVEHYEGVLLNLVQIVLTVGLDLLGQLLDASW